MKFTLTASALFALACSSSVFAAKLTIPMSFEYLALDGQEVQTNNFTHTADLDLSGGTHKIAIRYSDMYQDEFSDSQNFVKSSPFILTLEVDATQQYTLTPAAKIVDPKAYAKDPKVSIASKNGAKVTYTVQQTQLKEDSLVSKLFGANKGPDIDDAAVAVTAGQPIPVATAKEPTALENMTSAAPAAAATVAPTASPDSAAHASQMLQYWWLQADAATRKEFMSWAIKQL